jgi:hypothetical protein
MTIRQLHYTSCRQGRDGIDGFQVAASSPDLAPRHERLALPLAAYRPPPDAPAIPTAEQVAAFPVALGYRRFDDVAVLFHSRYTGVDFTGRQGNYFAHVLVLDEPDLDLAGLRPTEAWAAPAWTSQRTEGTRLPPLPEPPCGPFAERGRLHAAIGAVSAFPTVLDAVVRGLQGGPGVLLVADDAGEVAAVLAASARSLPAALAAELSFTTFSATPADLDLLVVGTTPDVAHTATAQAGRVLVRLDEPPSAVGAYAELAARCWELGPQAIDDLVALAERVQPPLRAEELAAFAPFGQLMLHGGDAATALAAVEFAGGRHRAGVTEELWRRADAAVDGQADGHAALDDVPRWSAAIRAAGAQGLGPAVESAYLRTVLAEVAAGRLDPAALWMPRGPEVEAVAGGWAVAAVRATPTLATAARALATVTELAVTPSEPELREIADLAVIPELVDPTDAGVAARIRELPHHDRLLGLAAEQLEPRLVAAGPFEAVARGLPAATAELLVAAAAPGSRGAMVGRLALARAGSLDRMTVLREAVGEVGGEGDAETDGPRLGWMARLIWPDPPPVREATAICRAYLPAVVARSGLPATLVQRLTEDVQDPHALVEIGALARALSTAPIMEGLAPADQDIVRAARMEETFRDRPTASPDLAARAVDAARLADRVPAALGERLAAVVIGWLLTPQPSVAHADVLGPLLAGRPATWFLARYEPRLRDLLGATDPAKAATLLAGVAACGPSAQRLMDTACVEALRRRSKRELDAVGRALERQTSVAPPAAGTWSAWWADWRAANLGGSLLGNLRAGLQRRHDRC